MHDCGCSKLGNYEKNRWIFRGEYLKGDGNSDVISAWPADTGEKKVRGIDVAESNAQEINALENEARLDRIQEYLLKLIGGNRRLLTIEELYGNKKNIL